MFIPSIENTAPVVAGYRWIRFAASAEGLTAAQIGNHGKTDADGEEVTTFKGGWSGDQRQGRVSGGPVQDH